MNAQNSIVKKYTTYRHLRILTNVKGSQLKRSKNTSSIARVASKMSDKNLVTDDSDCDNNSSVGPSTSKIQYMKRKSLEIPKDFRKWESITKKNCDDAFTFKVVSYNVLAQTLLHGHLYLYKNCKPPHLDWNVRFEKIFKEINDLDPDIICLQEVEWCHIPKYYSRFESKGYISVYKCKTGDKIDGCAIYFKKEKFYLVDTDSVELYQPEIKLLNRHNVGIMLKLRAYSHPKVPIIVATTHLLYNPARTDVRIAQMQVMLAELDRFAYFDHESKGGTKGYYPIIFAGDFNSRPDSKVVKLLNGVYIQQIRPQMDFPQLNGNWIEIGITNNSQHLGVYLQRQNEISITNKPLFLHHSEKNPEKNTSDGDTTDEYTAARWRQIIECLRHRELFESPYLGTPLKLVSVYPLSEDVATTFQDAWVNVDYIQYSSCSNLVMLDRYRLPTPSECEVLGTLPNHVYGSDHLLLAAHFELRDTDLCE